MNAAVEIITGIMLVVGASFALVASIGIIRLKDVYMRMHAASKAGTLGSGLMLLALAVHAGDLAVVTRAIAGVVFFLLTAPISAHLLAKAAYAAGYRPCADTKEDALAKTVRPKS
ncbi:Na(+)/H(+) antiporter subunit G [Labrenzia sp. THAF191b]|jgi:multicomponent Na+:H+ antiporter subunit G|uniref:monovalent cation/H(+) antiporter subunit G n=1 Tax=unclassified Labrenzia TaxID=2648686 RepID=UPI001267E698|nr:MULTISPECIES: monovalent cation/H(+) antiporter subunit G [unclassified Labrenzia]QFS99332.1 Na(+)/H(+) antiporter subunit G [Labrenzia sp. THAF191b]QFT05646.1 Na(+)/H(+) antiporter subunit G [Labrenzia sp. THAF191a]QFT17190.1 Na(+)/H(+) antiporter subunit G [Labrenzia sp. THAF187b]